MEHQRVQRTSNWSPTFQKRSSPSNDDPPKTVQRKTAPASPSEHSIVDQSPEPSDWVRQDLVMMRIMANNPVVSQIFQQDSQPNVATEGNASTDAIGSESVQLKCADCTANDSIQVPEKELQQDNSNGSVREVQLAANGEKSSESKIQQVAAAGFRGSAASLPHLNQIQQSFGVDLSGVQAYVGGDAAAACQRMGAQAYASGNQIAFKEQPSLELAAHEAAHVVQQASGKVQLAGGVGQVGDEYENHADAVAAKVAAGQRVKGLLSEYQDTNPQNPENFQAKQQGRKIGESITQLSPNRGNSPVQLYQEIPDRRGGRFRLSDDSSILVRQDPYGSKDLWAAPGKVDDSNKTLRSISSGVLLRENVNAGSNIFVPTQEGGTKTLRKVIPVNQNANVCTDNMQIWADCGRAARQIIGGATGGARGIYKDPAKAGPDTNWKRTPRTYSGDQVKWKVLEDVLRKYQTHLRRTLLDEAQITEWKNQNQKPQLAQYFMKVYNKLPPEEREYLDRRTGINRWANPEVGQAYQIVTGGPAVGGRVDRTWVFHWAGVVMKSDNGNDNVTLENYSVSNYEAQNDQWIFQMYGSAPSSKDDRRRGQTFHEEHQKMGTHGETPTTIVMEGVK